jgi:two-component system cell cycle response regulator
MPARILVVEDNPTNLELMVYLLESFGYECLAASDGLEGVEAGLREAPDLIICDIQLPKIDGHEVARRLKSDPRFGSTPLVAVTALAMVGDRDRVLASGFDGYIAKPIFPETFIAAVEEFLPRKKRSPRPAWHRPSGLPSGDSLAPKPFGMPERALILVVDDIPENIGLAHSIFEPSGYRIVSAARVAEGISVASRERPDLILCDVHLAAESGYDFLRAAQENPVLASIPVVLISSSLPDSEERRQAASAGVKLVLRPIESARLLAEIEACLQASRSGRSQGGTTHGNHSGGG